MPVFDSNSSLPDWHFIKGYNSLKDYFPTMEMKPNPQCSNSACIERQKEYIEAKPARDAAAKAKLEAESTIIEGPLHIDNEWNISVVDDSTAEASSYAGGKPDILPEGLTRELPTAENSGSIADQEVTTIDTDLEELQRQLDALNAS